MKTPMQELIEQLEKKYREYTSHKGNDEWYASVAYGIEISIRHAKLMVDVEKEMIDESYQKEYQDGHEVAMNYTDLRKCKCGLAQVGGWTCVRTDCDQNVTYGGNK
jgi:hypothetical protein